MKTIFNIVIVVSVSVVCVFIVYANIRDWNRLEVVYQFKDDGRVYGLYPSDRVSRPYKCASDVIEGEASESAASNVERRQNEIAADALVMADRCRFQELVASPVYLDIRYWQDFKHARVEIEYEKDPDVDFQIGYKTGEGFNWKLTPLVGDAIRTNFAIAKNVRMSLLDVDLHGEYVPYSNVHRWILSSNNVQRLNKTIRVYGIKFTFTR